MSLAMHTTVRRLPGETPATGAMDFTTEPQGAVSYASAQLASIAFHVIKDLQEVVFVERGDYPRTCWVVTPGFVMPRDAIERLEHVITTCYGGGMILEFTGIIRWREELLR